MNKPLSILSLKEIEICRRAHNMVVPNYTNLIAREDAAMVHLIAAYDCLTLQSADTLEELADVNRAAAHAVTLRALVVDACELALREKQQYLYERSQQSVGLVNAFSDLFDPAVAGSTNEKKH